MTDYVKSTDFASKDALPSGTAAKLVKGTEIDDEFNNIATHIASKYDAADIASQNEAELETLNTKLITPLRLSQWADYNDGLVGQLQAFASTPASDGLLGWDASAAADSELSYFTMGTGLSFSGTTIALESGLQAISALAKTDGNIIVGNGSSWVAESGATARASLGLVIGTNVQAQSVMLDDISGLGAVAGADYIMVSTGAGTWALENGSTMRTSLGLGTGNTPQFAGLDIGGTSATLTRNPTNTDQLDMEGDIILSHQSASYNSGKIHFSTSAPTTEGNDGDIYFHHEA